MLQIKTLYKLATIENQSLWSDEMFLSILTKTYKEKTKNLKRFLSLLNDKNAE